ncbi:MAG: hypothetical protein PVG27_01905 [Chloroflexota bacterium]|jgi:hypothetical protein
MSCYHRYPHGCDWPVPPPDWFDAYGYRPRRYRDEVVVVREDDEEDWEEIRPRRRRVRRHRAEPGATEEITTASLRAQARALRAELERIEEDLATLTAEQDSPSAT